MRYLILLILFTGCQNWTVEPFVVTGVTTDGIYDGKGKYMLTINKSDIHLYTNTLYNVGDTIK